MVVFTQKTRVSRNVWSNLQAVSTVIEIVTLRFPLPKA